MKPEMINVFRSRQLHLLMDHGKLLEPEISEEQWHDHHGHHHRGADLLRHGPPHPHGHR